MRSRLLPTLLLSLAFCLNGSLGRAQTNMLLASEELLQETFTSYLRNKLYRSTAAIDYILLDTTTVLISKDSSTLLGFRFVDGKIYQVYAKYAYSNIPHIVKTYKYANTTESECTTISIDEKYLVVEGIYGYDPRNELSKNVVWEGYRKLKTVCIKSDQKEEKMEVVYKDDLPVSIIITESDGTVNHLKITFDVKQDLPEWFKQ